MRVTVNKAARALIVELRGLCDRLDEQNTTLARRDISDSVAMDVGADREAIKAAIVGVAYRLVGEAIKRPLSHDSGASR